MDVQAILKRQYARVFLHDEETGYITGLILEFPGCISQGVTPQDAWERLDAAAEAWLTSHTERVLPVPEPFETLNPHSRQAVGRLIPLWNAIAKWRDKYKPSGEEALTQSDHINQDLHVLAEKALKIVGYYRDPNDQDDSQN